MQYLVWRASHSEARTAEHAESKARAASVREGVLASNVVLEARSSASIEPAPRPALRTPSPTHPARNTRHPS